MADDPEQKGGSKGMAIAIFVFIGIILIVYTVYMVIAYVGGFFPFAEYSPTLTTVPANTVFSLGNVSDEPIVDDDNEDDLTDIVNGVLDANVAWYKGTGTAAIPLQGKVLGS